ncbi:MAG: helix-hairpin-helix domain-containing protein [Vicinamibacterales bacterium]
MAHAINLHVAGRLEEAARLLRDQGADPYRVRAYRRAAMVVRGCATAVDDVFRHHGLDGLKALPAVGDTIARAIRELLVGGRLPMLERLRGESDPVKLLTSVPGIGVALAERLHYELGLDTLADLEAAAHDGRLETVAGFGQKRLAGIRDSLAHRLGRVRPPGVRGQTGRGTGVGAVGRRSGISGAGRRRHSEADCAASLQPGPEGMAADSACQARRSPLHRALFEHRARAPGRQDARLGSPV